MWKRCQISRPTFFARATQSSMLTPSTGMNGTTSVAPMRGCAPECLVRSISSAALPTPRSAASATASGSPAMVTTLRLWSASLSRSSRYTPATWRMASTMASILAASRPSEKLGTHSTSRFMKSEILLMYDCAALHGQAAKVHTKIIRDFAVVGHVKGGQVSIFANFERAHAIVPAQRVGRINGRGGDRFGGRHAPLRAGERENHRHAERGARAGVVIGGGAQDRARFNQLARRRVLAESEVEAASRQHGADHVRKPQCANIAGVDFLQMVRARRLH